MANHVIPYGGYATLGTIDADRSDTVQVYNDTDVAVTVFWPQECLVSAPATEEVEARQTSAPQTISSTVPLQSEHEVKVEPVAPKVDISEVPETGSGHIVIVG